IRYECIFFSDCTICGNLRAVSNARLSVIVTFIIIYSIPGTFKLAPCRSIGDMMQWHGEQGFEVVSFQSAKDIHTQGSVICKGDPITATGVKSVKGQMFATCIVDGLEEQLYINLPFSLPGEFSENLDQSFSIDEILSSKPLRSKRLIYVEMEHRVTEKYLRGDLLLEPVYEIQAIMHLRKNIVKIPSNLEVDVSDVSEEQKEVTFIKPLSLLDLMNEPQDTFPAAVEILDSPGLLAPYKDEWTHCLRKGALLTVHSKQVTKKILATSMSNKVSQHFLISSMYKGMFRRRPREFHTTFDLCNAVSSEAPLHVVVTRDCMSNEDDQVSLCVGERLIALAKTTARVVSCGVPQDIDVLVCNKVEDDEDEEGMVEEVLLPWYLEGRFVEEIRDNRKYTISEICDGFNFPFEVKVTVKDPAFKIDPLKPFPAIKLEESILVPTLLVSLAEKPSDSFFIPVEWMSLSVQLLAERPSEDIAPTHVASVVELTESMYYDLRKCSNLSSCPPPRPPKRASNKILPATSTATSPPFPKHLDGTLRCCIKWKDYYNYYTHAHPHQDTHTYMHTHTRTRTCTHKHTHIDIQSPIACCYYCQTKPEAP
uniref:Thymocyte selection associated family member 2 n=1 Tax=Callorhinchus milii TaxID=7868 RepID=A0A4W3JMG2_CALMI